MRWELPEIVGSIFSRSAIAAIAVNLHLADIGEGS